MRCLVILALCGAFSSAALGAVDAEPQLSRAEWMLASRASVGERVVLTQLPLGAGRSGSVRMKRIEVYAPDARILVPEGGGFREVPRSDWLHFVADKSDPATPRLALSIAADGSSAEGTLLDADGHAFSVSGALVEGALKFRLRDTAVDAQGRATQFRCANDIGGGADLSLPTDVSKGLQIDPKAIDALTTASRSAVVAVDTDNEFMAQKFSNNTTNATNYIAALFTGMNVIYERDLDVTLAQGTTMLRTTPDPYSDPGTDIGDQLDEFGEVWVGTPALNAISCAFATQLSGKSPDANGSQGIAWVLANFNYCTAKNVNGGTSCSDGQCTAGHYSVFQVFKFAGSTAADDVSVVSHEIGHNFGARHTHCSSASTGAPASSATIDQCYNTEGGCYSGPKSCPATSTVNGVPNVKGTLMSYCDPFLSGLAGCTSSEVFATAHRTYLLPFVTNNVNNGCFTAALNHAPTLNAIANPAAILEDAAAQTVNLSGIGDGDGNTQVLTVTAASNNTGLIPNPTVTYTSPNATGSLGYTPVANQSGSALITVTVTDNGGTAGGGVNTFSRTFTVNVTAVNDAPTLNAIGNPAAIFEDAGAQTVNLSGIAAGPSESQALTVTATSNATGLIPNPTVTYTSANTTGSLSYTPVANQSGSATITVTVSDNGGTANGGVATFSRTFDVQVTGINDAPTLSAIADPAAILEDAGVQTVNLAGIGAGGGEVQTLAVTATSNATGLIPNPTVTYTSANATGSLSYTPVANQSGSATITVTATDNAGTANGGVNTFSRTFAVSVTPVNDAPTLTAISDPAAILEDAGAQTVNLAGIGAGTGDPAQTLTVTATSNTTGLIPNPGVTYTSANATGSLSYSPVANQSGSATITVTVSDNGGTANGGINTFVRTFNVAVTAVNDAPTVDAIADAALPLDPPPQTVNLSGIGAGPGDPAQNLTVSATSDNTGLIPNPTAVYTSPNATGSLLYAPTAAQTGVAVITVTVGDNGGGANGGVNTFSRTFTVSVGVALFSDGFE